MHKKMLSFFTQYKMEQKILICGKYCINKNAFHKSERPTNVEKVDFKIIALSNKEPYGYKVSYKYSIGYIYVIEGNALPL